jgi:hypothetical protein
MTDQIALRMGATPWRPASTATPVVVLDRYDIPLLGVVSQHGSNFLFNFLEGQPQEVNIWVYANLADQELEALQRATPEEIDDIVDQIFGTRETTVALATEGDGLLLSAVIKPCRTRKELIAVAISELARLARAEVNAVESIREHRDPTPGIQPCPA